MTARPIERLAEGPRNDELAGEQAHEALYELIADEIAESAVSATDDEEREAA